MNKKRKKRPGIYINYNAIRQDIQENDYIVKHRDELLARQNQLAHEKYEHERNRIKQEANDDKKTEMSKQEYEAYRNKVILDIEDSRKLSTWDKINKVGSTILGDALGYAGIGAGVGAAATSWSGPGAGVGTVAGTIIGGVLGVGKGIYDAVTDQQDPIGQSSIDFAKFVGRGVDFVVSNTIDDYITRPIHNRVTNYQGFNQRQEYTPEAIEDARQKWRKNNPEKSDIKAEEQKRSNEYNNLFKFSELIYEEMLDYQYNKYESDVSELASIGGKPEGYGLFDGNYWSDMSTTYLKNLNQAQRDSFAGLILRSNEDRYHIENYKKYLTIGKLIEQYRSDIELLSDFLAHPSDKKLSEQIKNKFGTTDYKTLLNIKKSTIDKYEDYRENYDEEAINKSVKFINDLAPSTWYGKIDTGISNWLDDLFTNRENSYYLDPDWMASPADEYDALRYELSDLGDESKSVKDRLQIISNYEKLRNKKIKYWQEGVDVNQELIDKLDRQHKVSDYYQFKEKNSKGFLFSGDTWMYKMPGLTGSSQSSWIKQAPGTISAILNTAAQFLPAGKLTTVGKVALGTVNASGVASGISAGRDENYAELALNYQQKFSRLLELKGLKNKFDKEGKEKLEKIGIHNPNSEDIMTYYMSGKWKSNDQDINDQAINATTGLGSLFQNDMAAVTTDEVIDAAIRMTPVRNSLASGKSVRAAHLMEKSQSSIGPLAGITKLGIKKGVEELMKYPAAAKLVKEVTDKTKLIASLPKKLMSPKAAKKFEQTSKYLKDLGKSAKNKIVKTTAGEAYWDDVFKPGVKQLGKNVAKSTFSEGIEEGKQYYHGLEFQNGEYSQDTYKQLLNIDRLWRDSWDGTKSALVALGVPFGSPFMTDDELVENVRGGMLGGFFQTGAMTTAQTTSNLISERYGKNGIYKAMLDLQSHGILDKASMRDAYLKGVAYAQDAFGGDVRVNNVRRAFDSLLKLNEKYKTQDPNKYMNPEYIKKQRDIFNKVIWLSNQFDLRTQEEINNDKKDNKISNFFKSVFSNEEQVISTTPKQLRDQLEKAGIEKGSDRFNKFIGLATMMMLESLDASNTNRNKIRERDKLINEFLTPYELSEDGQVSFTQTQVINGLKHLISQIVKPETDSQDNLLQGEQLKQWKDLIFRSNVGLFAKIASLMQLRDEINQAAANNVSLDGTKQDIDFINKRIDIYLKELLSSIKEEHRSYVSENASKMLEGLDGSDKLLEAVRASYLASFDNDYYQSMLTGILGGYQKPENETEDQKELPLSYTNVDVNELIDNIEEAIENDKLLSKRVEDDFDDKYNNRQQITAEIQRKQREQALLSERVAKDESDKTELNSFIPTIKSRKAIFSPEKIYKSAYKLAKKIKNSKDITEAIEILKKNGFGFAGKDQKVFGDRLNKLYEAYKNGEISRKDFAKAFVPGESRSIIDSNELGIIVDDNENNVVPKVSKKYERGKQMSSKERKKQQKALDEKDERNRKNNMWDYVDQFIYDHIEYAGNDTLEENYVTQASVVTATPVPTTDNASLQAGSSNNDETVNPLQQALDYLTKHITETDKLIKYVTGHDYFFEIDGKLVMYTRVHGILDDQYTPTSTELTFKNSIIKRLKDSFKENGLESFKNDVIELIKTTKKYHAIESINIDPYFEYIQQNPEDIDNVIESISDMIAFPVSGDAVSVGNIFDEICRIYFNENESVRNALNYDTLMFNYHGSMRNVNEFLNKDIYDSFVRELDAWREEFKNRKWILSTTRNKFYATFYDKNTGKKVNVCGETDMIAIDEQGHYYIIDFKTSMKKFYTEVYSSGEYNAFEDDTVRVARNGRVKARSTRKQYEM